MPHGPRAPLQERLRSQRLTSDQNQRAGAVLVQHRLKVRHGLGLSGNVGSEINGKILFNRKKYIIGTILVVNVW